mmetsp:Transcript_6907/g.11334  ORF Transcript_6907/g.11334 Transcript_6907/m.11334 type:complete len:202 (-) Transcript_6907:19-624(-)
MTTTEKPTPTASAVQVRAEDWEEGEEEVLDADRGLIERGSHSRPSSEGRHSKPQWNSGTNSDPTNGEEGELAVEEEIPFKRSRGAGSFAERRGSGRGWDDYRLRAGSAGAIGGPSYDRFSDRRGRGRERGLWGPGSSGGRGGHIPGDLADEYGMQGPPISGPKDRWRGRGGIVAGARDLDEGKRRSDEDYDALVKWLSVPV